MTLSNKYNTGRKMQPGLCTHATADVQSFLSAASHFRKELNTVLHTLHLAPQKVIDLEQTESATRCTNAWHLSETTILQQKNIEIPTI